MLQLVMNGVDLELPNDFEVEYEMENPFFYTDRIPVAYTQDFTIPATPHNLRQIGHCNRVATSLQSLTKYCAEIIHSGFVISRGEWKVGEVDNKDVTIKFIGADFPGSIRKHLHNLDFGENCFGEITRSSGARPGTTTISAETPKRNFVEKLEQLAELELPDYVAAPLSIKGAEFLQTETNADKYSNLRVMRVNSYRQQERAEKPSGTITGGSQVSDYNGYFLSSLRVLRAVKIIPAFRVGYLIGKLFNREIEGNIFNGDLNRLMLLCSYAPNYQIRDDSMVWTVEDDKVKIKFADYLPDIPANDFIKEMLKFPCATLFIKGNTYITELNKNILRRKATKDWSNKLEDGYSISIKRGEDYTFAVTQDKIEDVPVEREKIIVESIQEMITHLDTQKGDPDGNNIFCYEVKQTEQIFEAMPEPHLCTETDTHWKLKLLAQSPTKDLERDSTNDKGTFDMTPAAKVCKSVVVDYFCSNQSFQPSFENGKTSHIKCVMPEVEINTKEPIRASDMIVGLWNGKQISLKNSSGKSFIYPLISHSNYMPDGSKSGEVSLTIEGLLNNNHKEYKEWIEKDKLELIGNVRLSPKDLNQLDLRDKTYLLAKEFLIRKFNIVLKMKCIEPAKIEFVEG